MLVFAAACWLAIVGKRWEVGEENERERERQRAKWKKGFQNLIRISFNPLVCYYRNPRPQTQKLNKLEHYKVSLATKEPEALRPTPRAQRHLVRRKTNRQIIFRTKMLFSLFGFFIKIFLRIWKKRKKFEVLFSAVFRQKTKT